MTVEELLGDLPGVATNRMSRRSQRFRRTADSGEVLRVSLATFGQVVEKQGAVLLKVRRPPMHMMLVRQLPDRQPLAWRPSGSPRITPPSSPPAPSMINTTSITTVRWGRIEPSPPGRGVSASVAKANRHGQGSLGRRWRETADSTKRHRGPSPTQSPRGHRRSALAMLPRAVARLMPPCCWPPYKLHFAEGHSGARTFPFSPQRSRVGSTDTCRAARPIHGAPMCCHDSPSRAESTINCNPRTWASYASRPAGDAEYQRVRRFPV